MSYFGVFFGFILVGYCNGINILGFLPVPLQSHIKGFLPVFIELARKGYNVTVVSSFPIEDVPENYHQIIVHNVLKDVNFQQFQASDTVKFLIGPFIMWNFVHELLRLVYEIPELQNFIHSNDTKFDVVLIEQFYQESVIAIAHKFNAPVINLSPVIYPSTCKWTGNPINPAFMADIRLGYTDKIPFIGRVKSTINMIIQVWLDDWFNIPQQQSLMNKYFNYSGHEIRPSLPELLKNVSLTLIHTDSILTYQYPKLPSFIEMSGMYIKSHQQLPMDLQRIMDEAKYGVIYFSLGTNVNPKYVPKERVVALLGVLNGMPQTVFMKFEFDSTYKLPKNIIVQNWFPQTEILSHPNCKLFITHGGLHSIMETVYFGVPILGFPLFADQKTNMLFAEEKGFGINADFYSFTKDSLLNDFNLLINDTRYLNAAKKISILYHDKPIDPMNSTVYWIEYVIRHNGTEYLKSAAVHLKWYQMYLLDVIAFFFIILFVIINLFYYSIKFILKNLIETM